MRVTITAFKSTLLGERGKAGVKERLLDRTQPLAEFRPLWYRGLNAFQFVTGQAISNPVKHVETMFVGTDHFSPPLSNAHNFGGFLVNCRVYLVLN